MHADCRGLPLTAANAAAVAAFDATVDAYLGFARDTGDRLKATLKADPAMPLAHVLRGSFFLRRIGGSHAQRDLFTQILVDAGTRAGRREVARAVLEERAAARPGQLFYRTRSAALGA